MSSVIGNLHAVLGLDSTAFQKGMGDAGSSMRGLEAMAGNVQRSMAGLQATMQRAGAIFGALGLAVGIRGLADMADTWSDLQSRVGLAVGSMDKAGAVMQRLSDVADRTYSSIGQTTEGFLQNATTLRDLGLSTAQALDYTEALNNAMVVSGAKGDQATRVQTALSNAMALGALRGDNLNTILTAGGRVSELLADELGVTTLQLRKLGSEGKITADVILRALVGNMEKLREEADDMPATIGDGFIRIGNAMQRLIGTWDQLFGASEMVSGALVLIAENFDMIANGAMIAGGVILGSYVPALSAVVAGQLAVIASNPYLLAAVAIGAASAALIKFGNDIKVIEGQFGSLNDYIVAVFSRSKDVASAAMAEVRGAFDKSIDAMTTSLESIGASWDGVLDVTKTAFNRIAGFIYAVDKIAVAVFTGLPRAIAEGIIASMQLMVDLVQAGLNKVVDNINKVIEGLRSIPGAGGFIGDNFEPVNLGTIPNPLAGTARKMGNDISDAIDDAFNRDFLGEGRDAMASFADGIRQEANTRAANRAFANRFPILSPDDEGSGTLPTLPTGGDSGKSKKGAKAKTERPFFEAIEKDMLALQRQFQLIGKTKEESAALQARWEMLDEAKRRGIPVNEQLNEQINTYADRLGALTGELERAEIAQQQFDQAVDGIADAFAGALIAGESFRDGMAQVFKQIAADLIRSRIADMLGSLASAMGFGSRDPLAGALRNVGLPAIPAFATGVAHFRGGMATINERGGELAIMPSGTTVIPHDLSKRMIDGQGGGGKLEVHIHENAVEGPTQVRQSPGRIDVMLRKELGDLVRSGGLDGALSQRFGVRAKP